MASENENGDRIDVIAESYVGTIDTQKVIGILDDSQKNSLVFNGIANRERYEFIFHSAPCYVYVSQYSKLRS